MKKVSKDSRASGPGNKPPDIEVSPGDVASSGRRGPLESSPSRAKADFPTVAAKNRVIANIIAALAERDSFLVVGHKDPDEDCVSSMVAFALLASKFGKKAVLSLGPGLHGNFDYLLAICRYNSIQIDRSDNPPRCSVFALMDTAKPSMIDRPEIHAAAIADPSILKIEVDHHLGADSACTGDEGYRLVMSASSSCEVIGYLALKIRQRPDLLRFFQIDDLLTRNLVLAILSGILGDTQMGRFLETRRQKVFYRHFSALFEEMLAAKTRSDSGNFSTKEQVYHTLVSLSTQEADCFSFFSERIQELPGLRSVLLDAADSGLALGRFGSEIVVSVAKNLTNSLAEDSGKLGLVGYFDGEGEGALYQLRLRRSQSFTSLDLRDVMKRLSVTNGGGHAGAIGFRVPAAEMIADPERAGAIARAVAAMAA